VPVAWISACSGKGLRVQRYLSDLPHVYLHLHNEDIVLAYDTLCDRYMLVVKFSTFTHSLSLTPFSLRSLSTRILNPPANTTIYTRLPRLTFSRLVSKMAPIETITDKLETSELDDRSYRVVRLPNKLEALLVHDPETDKASASVNVKVGSFSDADDMPGMAHAVEHLLFMGTEKVRIQ